MAAITVINVPDGYGAVIINADQSRNGYDYCAYDYIDLPVGPRGPGLFPRPTNGIVELDYTPRATKVAIMAVDNSGFIGKDYFEVTGQLGGNPWDVEIGYEIMGITAPQVISGDTSFDFEDFAFINSNRLKKYARVERISSHTIPEPTPWFVATFDYDEPPIKSNYATIGAGLYDAPESVDDISPYPWNAMETGRATFVGSEPTQGWHGASRVEAYGFVGIPDSATLCEENHLPSGVGGMYYSFHELISESDGGWNFEYPTQTQKYVNMLWYNPEEYIVNPGGSLFMHGGFMVGQWASGNYSPGFDWYMNFPNGGVLKPGWFYMRLNSYKQVVYQSDYVHMGANIVSSITRPMTFSVPFEEAPARYDLASKFLIETAPPLEGEVSSESGVEGNTTIVSPITGVINSDSETIGDVTTIGPDGICFDLADRFLLEDILTSTNDPFSANPSIGVLDIIGKCNIAEVDIVGNCKIEEV